MSRFARRSEQSHGADGPDAAGTPSGTYRRLVHSTGPHFERVGNHFAGLARCKRLERVGLDSIVRGLSELGAPNQLVCQMRGTAANLVKHVDMFVDLGRRYGLPPERTVERAATRQGPYELARENLLRGCLYGAVQAAMTQYQADSASDDEVRATLREVAADERRHNELAWEINGWLTLMLNAGQRQQLRDAQRKAVAAARVQLEKPAPAELQYFAGVPSVTDALALYDSLVAELFSEPGDA